MRRGGGREFLLKHVDCGFVLGVLMLGLHWSQYGVVCATRMCGVRFGFSKVVLSSISPLAISFYMMVATNMCSSFLYCYLMIWLTMSMMTSLL